MVGGRYVDLAWPPPGSPNGVISSYRLTMNGAEIYEGSFGNHTQTGLSVFTGYRFILTGQWCICYRSLTFGGNGYFLVGGSRKWGGGWA